MIDLDINQISTIVNAVVNEATGRNATIQLVNDKDLVSVGTTLLKMGYDKTINSLSQVLTRTLFSERPYNGKLKALRRGSDEWGNHIRKIQQGVNEAVDDGLYDTTTPWDDSNMFKVSADKVLQTNWYGQSAYSFQKKFWRNQLKTAFNSAAEMSRFIADIYTAINSDIEQSEEELGRSTLANFMAYLIMSDESQGSVINLLDEYNTHTGSTLTTTTVYAKENYPDFVRFAHARIKSVSNFMTNRTELYHQIFTHPDDGEPFITRKHTPKSKQMLFMLGSDRYNFEARVFAETYHDNFLNAGNFEIVDYWQNINDPEHINISPSLLNADGTERTATAEEIAAVKEAHIVATIIDREAIGVSEVDRWTATTPMEAKRGFVNTFWHFNNRYWNDFGENGVVFVIA